MKEKTVKVIPILLTALVLVLGILAALYFAAPEREPAETQKEQVITVSSLEKIINVSELSAYTAVYNSTACVMDEKKPEKVDYYVAYEANVKAGIDFERIGIEVDTVRKTVTITMPEVHITEVTVDIGSMDFIFMDRKANSPSLSQSAYKVCKEDARSEAEEQEAIFEMAQKNAQNTLTALVEPFLEQVDEEFTLVIE